MVLCRNLHIQDNLKCSRFSDSSCKMSQKNSCYKVFQLLLELVPVVLGHIDYAICKAT